MISDLTLLTCNYNTSDMTIKMLESFFMFTQAPIPTVIVDNSDKEDLSIVCHKLFTVINNRNYKITGDYKQCSKNHAAAIDYALKNTINTKYCLLCDSDVIFKPDINKFIEFRHDYDIVGSINHEFIEPARLLPYCCIIDVEKFKSENRNYFDNARCIEPNIVLGKGHVNYIKYDTGASFYEDIKDSWKIKNFNDISNYYVHKGFGSHIEDAG